MKRVVPAKSEPATTATAKFWLEHSVNNDPQLYSQQPKWTGSLYDTDADDEEDYIHIDLGCETDEVQQLLGIEAEEGDLIQVEVKVTLIERRGVKVRGR